MIYFRDLDDAKIVGHAGNNLFQLAAGLALAEKHKTTLTLPDTWQYKEYFPETGVLKYALKSEIEKNIKSEYNEPHFHYSEIPYSDCMNLNGYFQSWRYFSELDLTLYFKNILPSFPTGYHLGGIHRRCGDYRKFESHHPIQPMEYYSKAMKHLSDISSIRSEDLTFLVFSNDIPDCRKMFAGPEYHFCDSPQEKTEGNSSTISDFKLMTQCRRFIISNSSYSWWAAYLNPNPDKIIVAPQRWFGPALAHHDTKDLYPADWVLV